MQPIKAPISAKHRLNYLLAPYAIKLYFGQEKYVLLGAGSSEAGRRIVNHSPTTDMQELLQVGSFCETSKCSLLIGGEHHNKLVFNNTLGQFPAHKLLLREQGVNFFNNTMRGPTRIGSNVTLSLGAVVLSGASIGDGAVIGANSTVTKDIPPFAIAAGTPARVIKMRFADADIETLLKLRWWDWDLQFLQKNLHLLNTDAPRNIPNQLDVNAIPYRAKGKCLCFMIPESDVLLGGEDAKWFFVGAETGGRRILAKDLPADFNGYINQINLPETAPLTYLPDLFERHGL